MTDAMTEGSCSRSDEIGEACRETVKITYTTSRNTTQGARLGWRTACAKAPQIPPWQITGLDTWSDLGALIHRLNSSPHRTVHSLFERGRNDPVTPGSCTQSEQRIRPDWQERRRSAGHCRATEIPAITGTLLGLGFTRQWGRDPWPPERPMLEDTFLCRGGVFLTHCHVVPATDP